MMLDLCNVFFVITGFNVIIVIDLLLDP